MTPGLPEDIYRREPLPTRQPTWPVVDELDLAEFLGAATIGTALPPEWRSEFTGITWYHRVMAMTLRLTPEQAAALRETAQREHRSMQDVARSAIDEYVHGRRRARTAHLDVIVAEDAELLERLGRA